MFSIDAALVGGVFGSVEKCTWTWMILFRIEVVTEVLPGHRGETGEADWMERLHSKDWKLSSVTDKNIGAAMLIWPGQAEFLFVNNLVIGSEWFWPFLVLDVGLSEHFTVFRKDFL